MPKDLQSYAYEPRPNSARKAASKTPRDMHNIAPAKGEPSRGKFAGIGAAKGGGMNGGGKKRNGKSS